MDIRFLGHACFELSDGDTRVLIDPFLTGNPKAGAEASEMNPTHIFLTHGHQDHYGDIVDIAKRTSAQVVAIVELASELEEEGVENVSNPNIGGTVEFDGGWVRLTPAWHTSTTPKGTVNTPAGLVINLGGKTVYHLGDTGLFSDLQLVKARDKVDVALVAIQHGEDLVAQCPHRLLERHRRCRDHTERERRRVRSGHLQPLGANDVVHWRREAVPRA